jgi:uncharacterized protein YukE
VTALLAAVEESPAATRVDPGDFEATARAFAAEQATLVQIMDTLRSNLAANSPCIGQDHSATYFVGLYRSAGETVMNGLTALVTLVGNIAQGLAQAGTDHSRADAISAADWHTTNYQTITVDTWDGTNPQVVPEITGYEPGWLPSILNGWWPCRDHGKLAGSIRAWQTTRQSLADLQTRLHSALTALVDNNQGPDLVELEAFWAEFTTGTAAIFPAMKSAIDAIAAGLNSYGQMIDQFEGELHDAITKAALEAGFEMLLAGIADLLTDGVASILSGPEGAAIAARAVSHLAPVVEHIIDALRVANTVHNIDIDGHTALASAIAAMPQPDLATHEAWQTGDDVQPANNPTPQGRFNPDETTIASYVQSHGHVVMPIHADHSTSTRTPDALVDGQPVEFKALQPTSTATALRNTLRKTESKGGQAPEVVIDTRATAPPIPAATAAATLQQYFGGSRPDSKGVVQRVTVMLADGTAVTWPPDYAGL